MDLVILSRAQMTRTTPGSAPLSKLPHFTRGPPPSCYHALHPIVVHSTFSHYSFSKHGDRCGSVVRFRFQGPRAPGSKPDSTDDPICMKGLTSSGERQSFSWRLLFEVGFIPDGPGREIGGKAGAVTIVCSVADVAKVYR
ncbi:hypothetical protein AVEN_223589-1 [Araneus ventricosus]|uniref:Uncharacterized protein n=1 Tax=Araneus ventricosus TaxID=182803 RepID=A0A4Y2HJH6_ARAVE|nr:hypothetical protein AVEN_223589-1 [Araneus ventricosus]